MQVCRSYGFPKRSCPIIYTLEGTLIGDAKQFIDHVKERYGKSIAITKETAKRRTQQNMKEINEEMRKKKEGLTLGEKIEKYLNKAKKKGIIKLLDEDFFQEEVHTGISFYVRRTNLMTPDRTLNIIDEAEVSKVQ